MAWGRGAFFLPDEAVVEVETHEAVVEVRAMQPGFLRIILSDEGDWQKIGAPLAILSDAADEALPDNAEGLVALAVNFEVV